jgi:hypothetical protein
MIIGRLFFRAVLSRKDSTLESRGIDGFSLNDWQESWLDRAHSDQIHAGPEQILYKALEIHVCVEGLV